MATRANIAIILTPEDQNVPLNFTSERFDGIRPLFRIGVEKEIEFTDIIASKPVLQIYNHHDGYPDHLGNVLKRYYNSYEQALALILAGNTSFVSKEHTDAYVCYEGYEDNKPRVLDYPRVNEEYLYTFVDGEWVMSEG